jgi:hypothetical protein
MAMNVHPEKLPLTPTTIMGKWQLHMEGGIDRVLSDRSRDELPALRSVKREPCRMLVAVASSPYSGEVRRACRETWAANPPPEMEVPFFTGDPRAGG